MKNIDELLKKLRACREAQNWAQRKTFVEVYTTCERGDWLCWLFARTNPEDVKLLTLVKAHQANTVRHLMKDARSIKAIDTAIAYGEGRATEEELSRAADDAYDVAGSYVAEAAARAASASADASYAASAAFAFAFAAAARFARATADAASYAAEAVARAAIYDAAARAAAWAARVEDASSAAWADAASAAARATIYTAAATAARAASYATATAYNAAAVSYATAAAYNAAEASYAAADAHAAAARQANQQLTADIFRKYISIKKFNI